MMGNYEEVQGVLHKKYRSVFGKRIFIIDNNGVKTSITAKIGSAEEMPHIEPDGTSRHSLLK